MNGEAYPSPEMLSGVEQRGTDESSLIGDAVAPSFFIDFEKDGEDY